MPMTTLLGFMGGIEEELGWLIKKMREYFINWKLPYCRSLNPISQEYRQKPSQQTWELTK